MSESFEQSAAEEIIVPEKKFQWNRELLETTYGQLDEQKKQDLYKRLQQHFTEFNPLQKQKVTFDNVREKLEKDPDLALKIYIAEMHLGAEMCLVQRGTSFDTAIFDDLAIDLSLQKQSEFFQGIPEPQRNAIINDLRREFPNIPADAFDRPARLKAQKERKEAYQAKNPHIPLSSGSIGLTKWEGLVIERWLGVSSMPPEDYEFIRDSSDGKRIDADGPNSWLETSSEELTRERAWYGPAVNEERIVSKTTPAPPDDLFVLCARIRAKGSPKPMEAMSQNEKISLGVREKLYAWVLSERKDAEYALTREYKRIKKIYERNLRTLEFLEGLKSQGNEKLKTLLEGSDDEILAHHTDAITGLHYLLQEIEDQASNLALSPHDPKRIGYGDEGAFSALVALGWSEDSKERRPTIVPTDEGRRIAEEFRQWELEQPLLAQVAKERHFILEAEGFFKHLRECRYPNLESLLGTINIHEAVTALDILATEAGFRSKLPRENGSGQKYDASQEGALFILEFLEWATIDRKNLDFKVMPTDIGERIARKFDTDTFSKPE